MGEHHVADHYVFVCRHQRQTIRTGQPLAQGIDQITNAALVVSKSGILHTTDPIVIVWALLPNTPARARVQRVVGSNTHGVTISHAVFAYGFVDAMKATLYLPIAVLLVGALATLLIQRRVATAGAAARQQPGAAGAQTRAG